MKSPPPPETLAKLRDGRAIRVRPIRPDDAQRLSEFHDKLSQNTIRLRFFTPLRHLSPKFARHLADVDFKARCAFVISFPGDDTIHGVGRYEGESIRSAEVAFVVEDDMQGLGIGPILLERLVEHARANAFERLTAVVLSENTMMLLLFRDSPYLPEIHIHRDTAFVKLDIREVADRPATEL